MSIKTISPRELHALKAAGHNVDLIDVRTPMEFREVHAEYARNVELATLEPTKVMTNDRMVPDRPLYVICRMGGRAQQACEKFIAAGFSDVVNVEGGTLAWVEAGLPVVRTEGVVSLERQVRIAAGILVAIGTLLGYLVHPALLGIPAFVGAGLIYAGVTNRCGMGLILTRMPWNRGCVAACCKKAEAC
ncbi:MAG: rhodanese-like domain-containing protein [Thermoguttaceae bacterium]